jgi:hypothetical protein
MSELPAERTPATEPPVAIWKVKSAYMAVGLLLGLIGGGAGALWVYMGASSTIEALESAAAIANERDSALQARAAVAAAETALEAQDLDSARKHLDVARLKLSEASGASSHLDVGVMATINERLAAVSVSASGGHTPDEISRADTALDEIGLALDRELIRSN